MKKRVLTGINTTGTLHLGNYVGALRPSIQQSRSDEVESFYFLADLHALIKCQDPVRLQRSRLQIAATWLAAGLDPEHVTFYRQSVDIYNQLQSKVEEIELQIHDCVLALAPPILTIPGIGAASAAVILSEFGDLSKFNNPSKLLSFAGMEPGYFQSGTSESTGKMVKHGSSHLRYAMMNCAQTVINNEPTFAAYYAKKRAEGKEHRAGMSVISFVLRSMLM